VTAFGGERHHYRADSEAGLGRGLRAGPEFRQSRSSRRRRGRASRLDRGAALVSRRRRTRRLQGFSKRRRMLSINAIARAPGRARLLGHGLDRKRGASRVIAFAAIRVPTWPRVSPRAPAGCTGSAPHLARRCEPRYRRPTRFCWPGGEPPGVTGFVRKQSRAIHGCGPRSLSARKRSRRPADRCVASRRPGAAASNLAVDCRFDDAPPGSGRVLEEAGERARANELARLGCSWACRSGRTVDPVVSVGAVDAWSAGAMP
jgi:hypothetical protein